MKKRRDELDQLFLDTKKFTDDELLSMVYCDGDYIIINEIKGENGRFYQNVTTILKIKNRLFAIDWHKGLTEYQDDWAIEQPYEVVEKTRTITETYYENIKEDK